VILISIIVLIAAANVYTTITLAKRGRIQTLASHAAQSARYEVTLDAAVQNVLHVIADLAAKIDVLGAQNNRAIALGDGINAQIAPLAEKIAALRDQHNADLYNLRHAVEVVHNHVIGDHVCGREVPRRNA
jgi:transposase-like protein